jgi:hypothetical protein
LIFVLFLINDAAVVGEVRDDVADEDNDDDGDVVATEYVLFCFERFVASLTANTT